MKNRLLILFVGVLLFSCGQSTTTSTDKTENQENTTIPKPTTVEEPEQINTNDSEKKEMQIKKLSLKPFDLTLLPTDWIRLTETDTATIIYYSCAGGNMIITLNPNDSTILFHGQQEDIEYEFIRSGISEDDKIHFVVNESNDFKSFSISWNNQRPELAKWDLTNYYLGDELHEELFVSQDHENDFVSIEQPCRECWDDEFCDQIESREE